MILSLLYIAINLSWVIYKAMLSHCLKCRKNTKSKNSKVVKTKNWRIMVTSSYAVCGIKTLRFIKDQEASEILSTLQLLIQYYLINLLVLLKDHGYRRDIASMVYKFFDKNTKGSTVKNQIM